MDQEDAQSGLIVSELLHFDYVSNMLFYTMAVAPLLLPGPQSTLDVDGKSISRLGMNYVQKTI